MAGPASCGSSRTVPAFFLSASLRLCWLRSDRSAQLVVPAQAPQSSAAALHSSVHSAWIEVLTRHARRCRPGSFDTLNSPGRPGQDNWTLDSRRIAGLQGWGWSDADAGHGETAHRGVSSLCCVLHDAHEADGRVPVSPTCKPNRRVASTLDSRETRLGRTARCDSVNCIPRRPQLGSSSLPLQ